jgi:SulP family sulfate permease
VTFLVVFFYRIEVGILLGVGLSVLLHLGRTMRPAIVRLGREGYSEYYRESARSDTRPIPGVLIVRVDESLYFANVQHLDRQLRNMVSDEGDVDYLILVGSAINRIDGTALQSLAELIHDLHQGGIEVYISELSATLRQQITLATFIREIGPERFYDRTHDAVTATGKLPDDQLPI